MVVFKCLQANINKERELTVDLFELANRSKSEIVGIQEPHTYLDKKAGHHKPTGISRRFNTIYHQSANRPKALLAVDRKFKLNQIERYKTEPMATGVIELDRKQLIVVSLYMNLKENGRDRDIQIDLDLLQRLFEEFDGENSKITIHRLELSLSQLGRRRKQATRSDESRPPARLHRRKHRDRPQQIRARSHLHEGGQPRWKG